MGRPRLDPSSSKNFDTTPGSETSNDNESVLFHPRFAAGQVFTPELWGVMLGHMYYMPAVIEIVEALAMPHRREQRAFPWQMRVPSAFVGRSFGMLFKSLLMGGWDRSPMSNDVSPST